ncbi:MAG: NUDIX hydrolase [Planctomycetota bacterium]|jgi:ADP-ribose pyrophosphatase
MSDDASGVPADPAPFEPFELASTERIYDSRWVGLRRDMLRLDDGQLQEHHVVEVSDAACVVPVRTDGRIVLIGQLRHTHGGTHWEVPAGRLEPGEEPLTCAGRELTEETGHVAGAIAPLPGFYTCNGISDHWIHPFLATGCEPSGEQRLDPSERLIVETFSVDEVEAMLRAGTIRDGLSLIALFQALPRLGG